MKKALLMAVCAAILLAMAAPAFAQYPPPKPPSCNWVNQTTGSHRTASPGDTLLVGGKNWQHNSSVIAGFHQPSTNNTETKVVPTNGQGTWFTTFVVPNDVQNGPAVLGAMGRDQAGKKFHCIMPVTIVGAASVKASTSEPAGITTGMASLAVLALGAVLLFWRNRRRVNSLAS